MTTNTTKIKNMIAGLFMVYGHKVQNEVISIWIQILQEYHIDILEISFKKLIKTRVYSTIPVPSEICVIADKIMQELSAEYDRRKTAYTLGIPNMITDSTGFDTRFHSNPEYEKKCRELKKMIFHEFLHESKKYNKIQSKIEQ